MKFLKLSFLFFFVFIGLVNPTSNLDELINSYDYNYFDNDFIFNLNEIQVNEGLVILNSSIETNVGSYIFNYKIYSKENNLNLIKSFNYSLSQNYIDLNFDINISKLEKGNYIIYLEVIDFHSNEIVYRNYDLTNFEKVKNSNFIYSYELNETVITFNFSEFNYEIAYLEINGELFELNQNLEFNLEILLKQYNNIQISDMILDYGQILFKVPLFLEFNFSNQTVIRNIGDLSFIDNDEDLVYDLVSFPVELNIEIEGYYNFKGIFGSKYDDSQIYFQRNYYLNEGLNTLFIFINASKLYENKLNGPYQLNYMEISDNEGNKFRQFQHNFSIMEFYYNFNKPKLADLFVYNISYSNISGEVNVSILNNGSRDSIGFIVSIVELDNFNKNDYIISTLNKKEIKNYSFMISSNLTNFLVYIDYYDRIEELDEENNYLYWPLELKEICGNNIDDDKDYLIDEDCTSLCLETTYPEEYWVRVWCDNKMNQTLNKTDLVDSYSFYQDFVKEKDSENQTRNLSFRMSRKIYFEDDEYIFGYANQEGIKIYLDEKEIVNSWDKINNNVQFTKWFSLNGYHDIKIEFYNDKLGGDSFVYFNVSNQCFYGTKGNGKSSCKSLNVKDLRK